MGNIDADAKSDTGYISQETDMMADSKMVVIIP